MDANQDQTRRAVSAAVIGNVLEWYDFAVYAYVAVIHREEVFSGRAIEVTALLATFLTYGLGFLARPLGGIILGRIGDTHGRKTALLITIALMAVGTVLIGILPTYASIGVAAPLLLVVARLLQGFSAGGEWGSSTAYIVEWAPQDQRGFYGSFQQTSVVAGLLLGSGIAALFATLLTTEQMDGWGWRVPFLLGGILGPVGLVDAAHDRRNAGLHEGEGGAGSRRPASRALAARRPRLRLHHRVDRVLLRAAQLHADLVRGQYLKITPAAALWANTIGLFVLMVFIPVMGMLSDKWGRKPLLLACCIAYIVVPYPIFKYPARRRLLHRTDPGADPVRDPDLDVLGAGTGGDRRNVPDAHALDLDDIGLCARGRDLRRLCAIHLGVADQHVRLADRARLLSDRGGDRLDHRHRDAARNCASSRWLAAERQAC